MLKHGKVEVEIEMTNSFGDKPMDVYNTVAEIRGKRAAGRGGDPRRASGFVGPGDRING